MKIEVDSHLPIMIKMSEQIENGNRYLAFHRELEVIGKDDIIFFKDLPRLVEFVKVAFENFQDFGTLDLNHACFALKDAIDNPKHIIKEDGLINVARMAVSYKKRLMKQQVLNNIKSKVMNEQDVKDLQEQIKFSGFQEDFTKQLKELLKKDRAQSSFKTEKTMENNDHLAVTLNFGKSEKTNKHYLNNYHVKMTKENGEVMEQTFYRNYGNSISMKEAYNLMHGRAVYKTNMMGQGEKPYNAWLQMDFTKADKNGNYKYHKFHDNYGFDLEAKLTERGYTQMNVTGDENYFVNAIKKGDIVLATRQENGQEIKEYVEANPRFKDLKVYDLNFQRQYLQKKEGESVGNGQKVDGKVQGAKQNGTSNSRRTPAKVNKEGAKAQSTRPKRSPKKTA